jgi:hypothetical protein
MVKQRAPPPKPAASTAPRADTDPTSPDFTFPDGDDAVAEARLPNQGLTLVHFSAQLKPCLSQ